jgi:hypothetical protein
MSPLQANAKAGAIEFYSPIIPQQVALRCDEVMTAFGGSPIIVY